MKKNILYFGILTFTIFISACTTNDENDINDNIAKLQADVEELTNIALTGPWVITNFVDSGQNETADFEGYGFSFNEDGSLVADNGTDTIAGSWSITIDDDNSDDSDVGIHDDTHDDDCDSCTVEQLAEVLTACSDWYVDKLERNDNDLEDNFTAYRFNFSPGGEVSVTASSETFTGSWEASGNGNNISVIITIAELEDLNDNWTLHEIELENGESKVDMRINGEDRLRFKNDCTIGNFQGGHSTGEIDFNIFFASPDDFNELSEDWNIVSFSENKIELIHVSGGDGDTDMLTFEKN